MIIVMENPQKLLSRAPKGINPLSVLIWSGVDKVLWVVHHIVSETIVFKVAITRPTIRINYGSVLGPVLYYWYQCCVITVFHWYHIHWASFVHHMNRRPILPHYLSFNGYIYAFQRHFGLFECGRTGSGYAWYLYILYKFNFERAHNFF